MNYSYCYRALDDSKRQIRIVTLEPSTTTEEIRSGEIKCKLRIVSLDDNPKYKALSYVWGDPAITRTISLEVSAFEVTTNLYCALIRLRQATESVDLWIDAICIDQGNLEERASQVGLMGAIYRNASEGILWVGEEIEGSEHAAMGKVETEEESELLISRRDGMKNAFEALRTLASDHHLIPFSKIPGVGAYKTPGVGAKGQSHNINPLSPVGLEALKSLLTRAWWYRAWVVQETVLPRRANLVCGQFSIPWDVVERAGRHWFLHQRTCCAEISRDIPEALGYHLQTAFSGVRELSRMRKARAEGRQTDLVNMFLAFWGRQSTDPRDKIYAFLGLVTPGGSMASEITVDYGLPRLNVYEEVIRLSILNSNSLAVLLRPMGHDPKSNFPSWVVDWSLPIRRPELANIGYQRSLQYNASRDTPAHADFFPNSTLRLRGIFIDRVRKVGQIPSAFLWKDFLVIYEDWYKVSGAGSASDRKYPAGGSAKDAFWRTLLGNLVSPADDSEWYSQKDTYRSAEEADYQNFLAWILSTQQKGAGLLDEIGQTLVGTVTTRRFFTTASEYYATGHLDVEQMMCYSSCLGVKFLLCCDPFRLKDITNLELLTTSKLHIIV